MEDNLMALFQDYGPAEEDPRRRRGLGGYGGIAGPEMSMQQLLPHMLGLPGYDFTGANFRGMQDMLERMGGGLKGPALGHLQNQGYRELGAPGFAPGTAQLPPGAMLGQGPGGEGPPGLDNRNAPGGPNVAPGNLATGQAISQPGLGRGAEARTQGWLNVAPGYAQAAKLGFGSQAFNERMQGNAGLGNRVAPAGGPAAAGTGKNRVAPAGGGPVGGTSKGSAAGTAGGGAGGTTKGTGGGAGGGAGGGGQAPSGVTPKVKAQAAAQSTARGGTGRENLAIQDTAGGVKGAKPKVNKPYDVIQAGGNPFVDTIHIAPNAGNNNTPSETRQTTPGKLKGLSPEQKAARKEAWQARVAKRQEARRVEKAPSAEQFGARAQGGLEPLPKAGKTKPAGRHPKGASGGRRY